jgi:NACHT domain
MPDPLTIAAGAWAWDKYGKSLTDKLAAAAKGRWDKFRWNDAAEKYRAKVKKLYGTMQIMGMAEEVPLDDIFTEAYLLDKPTAFSRFDIERLKQASADPEAPPPSAKRIGGLALVKRNKNLFILGKPGAGKTTFLKYIAIQAAEPDKPVIDKVPVFVSLKRWADSGTELLPFIEEQFDKCDFPAARPFVEELLKSGGAIVLFDGLDEVNQEGGQRDKQTLAINNFIEKYDRTQCLITCRLAASDYSFKPFTYVEIADFTPEQIETFVVNWFRNNEGEKDEETSKRFLAEFKREDNKGLRDLARTPLLLTLLCLSFNETLTFPQRRVEIYKEALDALLKKWDSSRKIKRDEVYRKLSLGHKENMLSHIAAETFEKNQYFIPQAELEKLIADFVKNVPPHDTNEATDGEAILKAIEAQHGIFVERAREIYSFSHLTFQEYFTAKYITDNAAKGALTVLIKKHYADKRWREVFLLTTSLLPDASRFMNTFKRELDELLGADERLRAILVWAYEKSASVSTTPYRVVSDCLDVELSKPTRNVAISLMDGAAWFWELDNILTPDRKLEEIVNTLRKSNLNNIAEELAALSPPVDNATIAERQEFSDSLQSLAKKYRDFGHEWNLTQAQVTRLKQFMSASTLLCDCLELAFMSPEEREAMLNSLYLPTAQASEA